MTKVSVIIPVYNAEPYLEKCMESIRTQTLKEIEIICVDDGSTDDSLLILQKYERIDHRIRILSQTHQNAGAARNYGMEYSSGKYLSFLDADDFFSSDMLEKMYWRAEETEADIVICGSQGYDNEKQYFHKLGGAWEADSKVKDIFSGNDIPEFIFQLTAGWAWDKIYRSDFIRRKKIRFQHTHIANDEFFVDIAYAEAERISYVNDKLIVHRTNVISSLEYTRSRWWMCSYDMLYGIEEELEKRGKYDSLERSFINRAASYIVWNVCTMAEPVYYRQFYEYTKTQGIKKLGLLDYPEEFYHELYVWEKIQKVDRLNEQEFLLDYVRELNEAVKEKEQVIINMDHAIKCMDHTIRKKVWNFPEEQFSEGEKILIYGYGEVGKDFSRQVRNSRKLQFAGAVDRNHEKYKTDSVEVFSIDQIENIKYDHIVIAIMKKDIAMEIQETLLRKGVKRDRIIWFDVLM